MGAGVGQDNREADQGDGGDGEGLEQMRGGGGEVVVLRMNEIIGDDQNQGKVGQDSERGGAIEYGGSSISNDLGPMRQLPGGESDALQGPAQTQVLWCRTCDLLADES